MYYFFLLIQISFLNIKDDLNLWKLVFLTCFFVTQDYSAREWVKQGAPKEKLMIGMPTYGRSFTLIDPTKFDIGAPASGGGTPGKYTGEAGFMSYYEVGHSQFLNVEIRLIRGKR